MFLQLCLSFWEGEKEVKTDSSATASYVVRCAIWYHLYNLKNVKNTHGGVLILVKLQASSLQDGSFFQIFEIFRNLGIAFNINIRKCFWTVINTSKIHYFYVEISTYYETSLKHVVGKISHIVLHVSIAAYSFILQMSWRSWVI